LCLVSLETKAPACLQCALIWRAPSNRSIRLKAADPRSSSKSMAFRPRLGDVFATLGAMTLLIPIAIAFFSSAFDGELWSGHVLGSELLWQFLVLLMLLFMLSCCIWLLSHAAAIAERLIAPRRLTNSAEILQIYPGGLSKRGRTEVRIAKLDLREVILEPYAGGYLHDVCIVHRAGPALLLATELPLEVAERLGLQIGSWLGTPERRSLDYRKTAAR
jgi:hypothetical protein